MSVYTLQNHDFGNDGKLVMHLHIGAHYMGFKPGNVIEITFLSPASEENSWYSNNSEHHAADDVRSALEAFDERIAAGGWNVSSKARKLEDILEAE